MDEKNATMGILNRDDFYKAMTIAFADAEHFTNALDDDGDIGVTCILKSGYENFFGDMVSSTDQVVWHDEDYVDRMMHNFSAALFELIPNAKKKEFDFVYQFVYSLTKYCYSEVYKSAYQTGRIDGEESGYENILSKIVDNDEIPWNDYLFCEDDDCEGERTVAHTEGECYVYFIKEDDIFRRHVKIGVAKDVGKRLQCLKTSSPIPLFVARSIRCDSRAEALIIEHNLHEYFKNYRTKSNNEWFNDRVLDKVEPMSNDYIKNVFNGKTKVEPLRLESEELCI